MIFTILILIASRIIQASYVPRDGYAGGDDYDNKHEGKCDKCDKKGDDGKDDGYNYVDSYDGKFYLGVKEYSNDKYYDIIYQLNDGQIEYGNYDKYPIKRETNSDCDTTTITTTYYNTTTYTTVIVSQTDESTITDSSDFVIAEEPTDEPFFEEPSDEPFDGTPSDDFPSEVITEEPSTSIFEELPESSSSSLLSSSSEGVYKRNESTDHHKPSTYYWFTLHKNVLKDSKKRIGEIVANHQFQFDYPVQPDALYTKGFSIVTYKGVKYLALNGNTKFWNSAVNDKGVYKIYDKPITDQSKPINLVILEPSKK